MCKDQVSVNLWSKMFGRVTFIPTLMYNIMMERVSARQWFNRIDDTLILGALPWKSITHEVNRPMCLQSNQLHTL